MLSEFSFTKKRKKVSLIFEWYIYIMVEPRILQNYGKLYIWTSELSQLKALQSNLFKWPPLSNYHCGVCPSKFLFNHYYLMRPATTFLTHKWKKKKKKLSKTLTIKALSSERMWKKHKEQYIKNKGLSNIIYSIANI